MYLEWDMIIRQNSVKPCRSYQKRPAASPRVQIMPTSSGTDGKGKEGHAMAIPNVRLRTKIQADGSTAYVLASLIYLIRFPRLEAWRSTMISTRRLFARSSALLLPAIGLSSPMPCALINSPG